MKKILVPVDFSTPSENALKVAAELAKRNDAELHVLHVIELAESLFGAEQFNVNDEQIVFFMKLAKERFENFLKKDYLKGIDLIDHVEPGSTSIAISEVVEKNNIDMIVMGSSGSSGLEEIVIGSNTEKVVRYSEVPVLVVKNEIKDISIKTVVFASDFELENIEPYRKAKKFAESFDAKMQMLYVNLPGNQFSSTLEIQEQMRVFLNKVEMPLNKKNIEIFNDYSIEQGVINGAEYLKADLIIIPTHGRKGLSHFFNGSISEDVVNHSDRPVLTLKI
ncbi:universal stress protein [Psychroflexus sediminis]|uniref:Nucleotide-binding universal stress protein, UspA family n=1 Tax=Psychroflexus sediminis TaxID=470826 RepID=A0A1G7Y7T5_9FLAO|nr:universal stress protein [Psychroflexus sediminis]SDG92512.1 Nucleotide-binding universal stress protein, UspA family [Psychroflexus sediminis]